MSDLASLQVLGADALGPVKRDFYALLCMRHPPKKEALYDVLRNMVTRLNTALPGAERKCVALRCADGISSRSYRGAD